MSRKIRRPAFFHSSGGSWPNQDVLFLIDSLEHGMSVTRVALFLNRNEDEVQKKAKELKLLRK